jgi:hypothetical protein
MDISTIYGTIEYDKLKDFDIPENILIFIEEQKEAVELFFQEDIDLKNVPVELKTYVQSLSEIIFMKDKFRDPARVFALSEFYEVNLFDIREKNGIFIIIGIEFDRTEYFVLTDEEATKLAINGVKNEIQDQGIEEFLTDLNVTKDIEDSLKTSMVGDKKVLDINAVVELTIKIHGRRKYISSFSKKEEQYTVNYKGKDCSFYIYNVG